MENSRSKPPPGVEEALSSMLWTPYPEQSESSSSSDESEKETQKRRKRPLTWGYSGSTSDMNYHQKSPFSISSRFSYPSYYTAPTFIPSLPALPAIHATAPPYNLVHSFTDNFTSYQVRKYSYIYFFAFKQYD